VFGGREVAVKQNMLMVKRHKFDEKQHGGYNSGESGRGESTTSSSSAGAKEVTDPENSDSGRSSDLAELKFFWMNKVRNSLFVFFSTS